MAWAARKIREKVARGRDYRGRLSEIRSFPTEDLDKHARALVARAYKRQRQGRSPSKETVDAIAPYAAFLMEESGLFRHVPEGPAAEIARRYSYNEWIRGAVHLLCIVIKHMPSDVGVNHMGVEVQGWALAHSPNDLILEVACALLDDDGPAAPVMRGWADSIYEQASTIKGANLARIPNKDAFPKFKDKPPADLMEMLFRYTPLQQFLSIWVPITFPDAAVRCHAHGMGTTGSGKTTLNEAIILSYLGKKGMVCFDTKGGMAERLIRHSGRPQDIVHINATDPDKRPMFNLAQPPLGAERDRVAAMMAFTLAGMGVGFTDLQQGTFEMLTKIVLAIPNAALEDFIKVIEDEDYAARHVPSCSSDVKAWFANQYGTPPIQSARQQIARKLWVLNGSEALSGLFNGERNTLDFLPLLNARKLVIITLDKNRLREHVNIVARSFIAPINAAMWRRKLPIGDAPDWVIFLDEFRDIVGTYDDRLVEEIADQGREYCVCLHVTHQRIEQMSKAIQSAVITNSAIKFYCNIMPKDASSLASLMGCQAGDMLDLPVGQHGYGYFCMAVDNYVRPSRCRIRFGYIQQRPRLSDADFERVNQAHRAFWQKANDRVAKRDAAKGPVQLVVDNASPAGPKKLPWADIETGDRP